jgi:dihydroceramidase
MRRRLVTALILGTIIPVSVYHVWTNEIIAHEILFGAMVILCGRKIRWLIKEKIQNEGSQKRLRTLANLGSGTLKSPLAFLPRDAGRLSAVAECSRI